MAMQQILVQPREVAEEAQQRPGRFGIEDLQSSWSILFLRVFHAWCFFVGLVSIAGMGVNTFLNMFAEFCDFLSDHKRLLEKTDQLHIVHLVCVAALLVLLYAGLLQRGCWLLLDCMERDMFINYRRTLCLEGPGPGSFDEKRRMYNPSSENGSVSADVEVTREQRENLVNNQALPARFRFCDRRAAFNRTACLSCVHAGADVFFQLAIFATLDVLPLAVGVLGCNNLVELFSLSWLDRFTTFAIKVAVGHVWVYLLVSTLVDYAWKVAYLFQTWRVRRNARQGRAVPPHAMQAVLGAANEAPSGSLNLCVCLGNILVLPKCQRVLCVGGLLLLVGSLVVFYWFDNQEIGTWLLALFMVIFFVSVHFKCRQPSQRDLVDTFSVDNPWAMWFRSHCGVSPRAVLFVELTLFALGLAVILFALCVVKTGFHTWQTVASACLLWPVLGAYVALRRPDSLWLFALAECIIFGSLCIVTAWLKDEVTPQCTQFCLGNLTRNSFVLIFLTQLGMWRQGKTHSHTLSAGFFIVIVVAIATLSLVASSSANGFALGSQGREWCPNGESCKEFRFPLNGSSPYAFCGISWEMAPGDTVSGQCEDTKFSIIDFAQISSVAGYMPNSSKVHEALEKYLPGWKVVHQQSYNVSAGTKTTFIHLMRGSTSVIAVRGTSTAVEALQDLNLWMRIGFLQLARKIGPSCYNATSILETFTGNQTVLTGKSFTDLADYVADVTANSSASEKLYITGHSLGGGLAAAMGGIFNIPAVTFSAPGLEATSAILRPQPQETLLVHRSVNVVPAWDVVPMVDQQTGSSLRIRCRAERPFKCHSLRSTMCELLDACGDGGGRPIHRGYNRSCKVCEPASSSPASCSLNGTL